MPEAPSQPSDAEDNTAASSVPTAPAPASAFGMRSSLFSLSQRVPDGSGLATSAFSLQSSTSSFIGARSTNVLAPAPASAMSATAVAGAPATEPMVDLEVCTMLNPKNGTKLRVPANATIAEVKAQLRPSGEMVTLLWAGQMLTCPSETLCELGISGSQRLSMVDRMTPDTGPLGMIQLSDAAKAAAARAAAATAAGFSPVGPAASPGSASEPLAGASSANAAAPVQVTKVNGQKMQVPYDAAMTGIGLKRQLQLRGEGDVRAIRLIYLGKELVDDLPLSAQRVQPGAIVYFMLREVPPSAAGSGAAAGGASGLGSRLGAGAAGSWGPVSHGSGNGAAGERREGQWVGLRNQGATCYLNSLVQALFMTPSFRASVSELGELGAAGAAAGRGTAAAAAAGAGAAAAAGGSAAVSAEPLPAVTKALVDLFDQLRHSQYAVSTEGLTSALKWGPVSRQQDVHEFWTMLCERIEADLKGTAHGTLVEDLFQGEQRDYVRCHTCGTVSHRTDRFQDLKLAVPHDEPAAAGTGTGGPNGATAAGGGGVGAVPPGGASCTANVREALRQLLTPEQLRGSEMYQCDCCGCKTDAERGVQLTRLPPILTLQLKRFRYDFRSNTRAKISSAFDFPLYLDMTPFVGLAGPAPALAVEDPTPMDTGNAISSAHRSAGVRLLATLDTHDAAHDDDTSAAPSNASLWETSNASSALSGGSPTMTPYGGSPTMTPNGGSPLSAAATEVAGDASTMDVDTPTVVEGETATGTPSAAVYELYAVLVHKGSASFGHYYALLQDVERGEWYEFNDATVKPIKPSELRRAVGGAESAASGSYSWSGSTCAYMLLYRQVTDPKRIQQALAAAAAAPGVMATPQDRFPSTGGHTLGGAPGGAGVGSGGAASGGTPVGGGGVRMSRLLSAATSSTASAGETRSPLAPASENAKRLREASEQTDEPAGTTHAAPICFTHEPVEEDNPYARMGF
jgi:hypothetical protein